MRSNKTQKRKKKKADLWDATWCGMVIQNLSVISYSVDFIGPEWCGSVIQNISRDFLRVIVVGVVV